MEEAAAEEFLIFSSEGMKKILVHEGIPFLASGE